MDLLKTAEGMMDDVRSMEFLIGQLQKRDDASTISKKEFQAQFVISEESHEKLKTSISNLRKQVQETLKIARDTLTQEIDAQLKGQRGKTEGKKKRARGVDPPQVAKKGS